MNSKRNRSMNWDEEEKHLLRSVLKNNAHIIEDKSLNTNTNKMKIKAWEEVHKKFNELNCRQRNLGQLKIQWKAMKVNARKTCSSFKNEINKTGGGARPATPDDSVIEVKDLMNPAELLRDHNPYDSDGLDTKALAVNYPAKDIISCQEIQQDYNIITIEEVDAQIDAQNDIPLRISEDESLNTNMAKITARKVPKRRSIIKNKAETISKTGKNHDYIRTMICHSKKMKEEEHRRRMEMAEELHEINIKIHEEKLKCVILEREIKELDKSTKENLLY